MTNTQLFYNAHMMSHGITILRNMHIKTTHVYYCLVLKNLLNTEHFCQIQMKPES